MKTVDALNQQFEVAPQEAEELYNNGLNLGELQNQGEHLGDHDMPDASVRSRDGQWLIRAEPAQHFIEDADYACAQGLKEHLKLRRYGVFIVSHAFTPSIDGSILYTVTPWISGMEPCPLPYYKRYIEPRLRLYHTQKLRLVKATGIEPPCLTDVAWPHQYSVVPSQALPGFLHDVGPGAKLDHESFEYHVKKWGLR